VVVIRWVLEHQSVDGTEVGAGPWHPDAGSGAGRHATQFALVQQMAGGRLSAMCRRMLRCSRNAALTCAAVVLSCIADPTVAVAQDPASKNYQTLPAIDAVAEQALQRVPLAGLSIAVAHGSEIIHAAGYGYANLEHKVPATPETVYRIGSITKHYTAAAILQLVDEGKIGLDADMHEYLPAYPTGGRVVTIRQLLNHTSGIKSADEIPHVMANRSLDVTTKQMLDWIGSEPFDFEPGEEFRYNNSGPWLLGVMLETLSGETYGDYLRTALFNPLGLGDTSYDSYSRVIPNRARGYLFQDGQFIHAEVNSPSRPYASGALLSTVLDMVAWQQALFSGKVIKKTTLAWMTSPGHLNNGKEFPYGFGLRIGDFHGHRKISHGGSIIGFRAIMSHYPDDAVIIVVLTNTDGHREHPRIEQEIANIVFAIDTDKAMTLSEKEEQPMP